MILPGFPLEVGGTTKCPSGWVLSIGNAELDGHAAVAHLAQRCEEELRARLKAGKGNQEELAAMVKDVAMSANFQPYLDRIHEVRLLGGVLEVEFSAAGYPNRYVSYVGVDGTGGRYKLRELERTIPVVSSRCSWEQSADGTTCVAEALDGKGEVLSRVRVSIEHREQDGLAHYQGQGGIRVVEETAMRLARTTVLERRD